MNKPKRNLKNNLLLFAGIIVLLLGVVLIALRILDVKVSSFILNVGLILIIIGAFRKLKKKNLPEKDERTKKISSHALSYSWLITFLLITVLFWLEFFNLFLLTTTQYYYVLFMTMILSASAFQWYYNKKGDVE